MHFEVQKIPPKIVFFQFFLIPLNFCPQIFDMFLLGTKTTLPNIKIHTISFSTCFNHLQVSGTGCRGIIFIFGNCMFDIPDDWTNHLDCKTTISMSVGTHHQQMYVGSARVENTQINKMQLKFFTCNHSTKSIKSC